MPQCRECGDELNDANWYPAHRKINSRICKGCMKRNGAKRYVENSESIKMHVMEYYDENKLVINKKRRDEYKNNPEYRETLSMERKQYYQQLKTDVIAHYSDETMACANPHNIHAVSFTILGALSIDHPFNDGANERLRLFGSSRKGGYPFYSWLKAHDYPEGYRVLCMTCQMMSEIQKQRAARKKDTRYSRYRARLKFDVLAHYSGHTPPRCANSYHIHEAPFTLIDGLSLEHINGGGTQHYRKLGVGSSGMYQWLKKNGYPTGYSVLCFNCQFLTASKRRREQQELGAR